MLNNNDGRFAQITKLALVGILVFKVTEWTNLPSDGTTTKRQKVMPHKRVKSICRQKKLLWRFSNVWSRHADLKTNKKHDPSPSPYYLLPKYCICNGNNFLVFTVQSISFSYPKSFPHLTCKHFDGTIHSSEFKNNHSYLDKFNHFFRSNLMHSTDKKNLPSNHTVQRYYHLHNPWLNYLRTSIIELIKWAHLLTGTFFFFYF